jgi:outer membrane protein insertion porin family
MISFGFKYLRLRLDLWGLVLLVLGALLFAGTAQTQDAGFQIEDIRIEGLQRVPASVAFGALPVGVGDTLRPVDAASIIRDLYATENFDDIRVSHLDSLLIISVVERPFIHNIEISGNKAIATEDLLDGLAEQGLSSGQVLKRAALEGIRQELRRQYSSRGRYDSDVSAEIEVLPRNRVAISLNINEGTPAHVFRINIIGNQLFPTSTLIGLFESRNAGGFLGFFGKKGQYSHETLSSDLDRLVSYYKDRGYLEFLIESVQVSVTPDKKAVFIGVSVSEGEQFKIKEINFFGNLVLPEERLRRFVLASVGALYSDSQVTNTEALLTRLLNNEGYLDAKVRGTPSVEEDSKDVELRFIVTPGKRTYVRRINFSGNVNTNDEVLRREMRQLEGAPASRVAIDNSRLRLERLRFIRGANIDTVPVAGSEEEVDLDVSVEGQASGNIIFSLGYNETFGALYQLSLQRDNFFGTGRNINVQLRRDRATDSFSLSFQEPYFTADGVSRSFNLYSRDIDLEEVNITRYATRSYGAGVNFGYPLNETSNLSFGLSYDNTDIAVGRAPVQEIRGTPLPVSGIDTVLIPIPESTHVQTRSLSAAHDLRALPLGFVDIAGEEFESYKFNLGWNVFRLNRGQLATRGYAQSIAMETTIPGSDVDYYKMRYRFEHFQPLSRGWTLRTILRLGYGDGYDSTEALPFFEHFFTGGLNSVRGHETNSLGPRSTPARSYLVQRRLDVATGEQQTGYVQTTENCPGGSSICLVTGQSIGSDEPDPYGGNLLTVLNLEVLFPLPFAIDPRSVRAGFFLDVGNVFDTNCASFRQFCEDFSRSGLRATVGLGVVWITPFGPLNFSFAYPLDEESEDDTDTFEFSIGTGFGL